MSTTDLRVLEGQAEPPHLESAGRSRLALVIGLVAIAAAIPILLVLPMPSNWASTSLLFALLCVGLISAFGAIDIKSNWSLDAGDAPALMALVILGPLPALAVLAIPDIVQWFHERFRVSALVGNFASFTWAVVAAALVLTLADIGVPLETPSPGAVVAIVIAGLAAVSANFLICRRLITLSDGLPFTALMAREYSVQIAVAIPVVLAGAAGAVLYQSIGLGAAGVVAGLLLIWHLVAPRFLVRASQPFGRDSDVVAFADAIASILALDTRQQRVVRDAASCVDGSSSLTQLGEFGDVMTVVLHSTEHWDGEAGFPRTFRGEAIPIESRILAVSTAWKLLSSGRSRPLPTETIAANLGARAGSEFDPRVVDAAIRAMNGGAWIEPRLRTAAATQ